MVPIILSFSAVLVHLDRWTSLRKVWMNAFRPGSCFELCFILFLLVWWFIATWIEGKACVSFCIIAMRNLLYTTPVRVRCCTTLLFLGPPCVNSGAELSCGERHRQGIIPLEQMFSSTVLQTPNRAGCHFSFYLPAFWFCRVADTAVSWRGCVFCACHYIVLTLALYAIFCCLWRGHSDQCIGREEGRQ